MKVMFRISVAITESLHMIFLAGAGVGGSPTNPMKNSLDIYTVYSLEPLFTVFLFS